MPKRRAGLSWRLLVHDAPKVKGGMSDKAHHIESTASHTKSVRNLKALGIYEKVVTLREAHPEHSETTILPGDTAFDELVVDSWIHIEQMDDNLWWMNIGGVTVHVTADRDGKPKLVTVHMPGHYDDPRPGCAYRLNGEPYEVD